MSTDQMKHHLYSTFALISLFIFSACCINLQAKDEDYTALLLKGEYNDAERLIRRELRDNGLSDSEATILHIALVDALEGQEKEKKAADHIQSLPASLKKTPAGIMLVGKMLTFQKKYNEAIKQLRTMPAAQDVLLGVRGTLPLAFAYNETKAYKEGIEACQQILKRQGEVSDSSPEAKELFTKVRKQLAILRDNWALAELGEDYQHYRRGRIAQANRKYEEAIEHYEKIVNNPALKDAASCYMAESYMELGEDHKGERAYKAFIDANPYGLYRGEALVRRAYFQLIDGKNRSDLKQLLADLTQAVEWFETIETHQPDLRIGDMTFALKHFPAPDKYTRPGDIGGLVRDYAGPGTILNRLTAKWYLPLFHVQALVLKGYVEFEMMTKEEDAVIVQETFERIHSLNRAYGGAFLQSSHLRHQLWYGMKTGSFLISPGAWDRLSPTYRREIRLASMFAACGEFESAQSLYRMVLKRDKDGKKMGREDRAAVHYGLAVCSFGEEDISKAIKYLQIFMDEEKRSIQAPDAWLLLANLQAPDADKFSLCTKLYSEVAKRSRDQELAAKAMLSMAIMAVNQGKNTHAAKACYHLKKHFAETAYAAAASTLLDRLYVGEGVVRDGLPIADPKDVVDEERGLVQPVQAHILIPGKIKIHTNYDFTKPKDILRYDVTASPQSECIVIREFTLWHTIYEPQIPKAIGRQTSFLRAPALYGHLLWSAPKTEADTYVTTKDGKLLHWKGELQGYLFKKDYRQAARLLQGLLEDENTDRGYISYLIADLAEVYREGGAPAKALELIEKQEHLVKVQPAVRLQKALATVDSGDKESALRDFLLISDKSQQPEIRSEALYQAASILLEDGKFDDARSKANEFIDVASGSTSSKVKTRIPAVKELVEQSREKEITRDFGSAYWKYRQGRRAQQKGQYTQAIDAYRQVTDHSLTEATQLYIADCLSALREDRDAEKAYEAFIQTFPNGPFTAEALTNYAIHTYLRGNGKSSTRQALQLLDQADKILSSGKSWSVPKDQQSIMEAHTISPAMTRPGHRLWPGADTIFSAATCPWYGDYHLIRLNLLRTFVQTELGQRDEAVATAKRVSDLIAAKGINIESLSSRLKAGVESESFLLSKKAWVKLSRDLRQPIHLAAFYCVAGLYDEAQDLIKAEKDAARKRDKSPLDLDDQAAIGLITSATLFAADREDQGVKEASRFESEWQQTPTYVQGSLYLQVGR